MTSITIRPEAPDDYRTIDSILQAAFAGEPHSQQNEGAMVRALRRDGALSLALVAEVEGEVVGHAAVSPVRIEGRATDWYGLGPLAVLPKHQRHGLGAALVTRALEKLRSRGAAGWVVLGDPAYYSRFGFAPATSLVLPGVPAEYFQAMLITGEAMPCGVVSYHPALMGVGLDC